MLSNTTRLAVAPQSVKGTAATTGFYAMRMERSSVLPAFEYEEALNEHTGVHQRASTRVTVPDRISKMINVAGNGFLYPSAIGVLLQGVGFGIASVNNTTYYTHTATKSDTDAAKWLSVMHAIGEDSARWERKVKDVRLTQLQLTATRNNIQVNFEGMGLDESESAGTETVTAEANFRIVPATGSLAWDAQALGTPRQHTVTITRPVEQDDQLLHAFGRAGADEVGFEISGQMRGLDMSEAFYNKLVYGGAAGTSMSQVCVTDGIVFSWESASNISGAATPYRLAFDITKADIRLTNFEAQGNGIIRADVDWYMLDDTASAPVSIAFDNAVASY